MNIPPSAVLLRRTGRHGVQAGWIIGKTPGKGKREIAKKTVREGLKRRNGAIERRFIFLDRTLQQNHLADGSREAGADSSSQKRIKAT